MLWNHWWRHDIIIFLCTALVACRMVNYRMHLWLFLILETFWMNKESSYGASPYCLFPGCVVTWAWSLAKGQYMVEWLLTGTPKQRYWQNRETAKVGQDISVGRAPARHSGGRRFKSRSSQFVICSLFIQNLYKQCTQSVSLVVYWMLFNFIYTFIYTNQILIDNNSEKGSYQKYNPS